ncbi:LuxR C-terminal-related transcriptional regulator [Aquitalea sp.]|uniref:helix-turn-helix transcriptional regulator n=1 Tax=Aquitalea sp. TaxID=1872623 RepID=UPI0025862F4C|nr:LuxR C-terminal-related transcriptional regulator [Aquitalea sp.]
MNHLLADAPVAKPLQRCLDVLQDVLPHSATAFYRVDRQQQPHDFVLRHMPQEVHQRYVARYMGHDPLHPARLARQPLDVVTLGSALPAAQRATSRYAPFLASNRLVDVAEILLRRQGRVVAGFSLLRQGRMPAFADDELRVLHGLHGLLDMALDSMLSQPCPAPAIVLTEREQAVAMLLSTGACNKTIARELNMGLATVKTHLLHLFRKFDVSSRTALAHALFVRQQAVQQLRQ